MTTSIVESPSPVLINIAFSPALGLNDKEPFEICLRISLTIITKYKKAMKSKKKSEDLNQTKTILHNQCLLKQSHLCPLCLR